jgi:vancomycin resistance protein VanW
MGERKKRNNFILTCFLPHLFTTLGIRMNSGDTSKLRFDKSPKIEEIERCILSCRFQVLRDQVMKKLLPPALRLVLRVMLRSMQDWRSGQGRRIVRKARWVDDLAAQFEIVQELKGSSYSDNKRQNLVLASQRINQIVILPGEVFSFWALVGAPSRRKGYLEGRTLVQGALQAEVGGGLCQLSGLIYYLALQAGLQVVERYPHSIDIYTDETRFTPLGSDATVVYGYKDLRVVNSLSQPICFNVQVDADRVIGELWTTQPIAPYEVIFTTTTHGKGVEVLTTRRSPHRSDADPEIVAVSYYRLPESIPVTATV